MRSVVSSLTEVKFMDADWCFMEHRCTALTCYVSTSDKGSKPVSAPHLLTGIESSLFALAAWLDAQERLCLIRGFLLWTLACSCLPFWENVEVLSFDNGLQPWCNEEDRQSDVVEKHGRGVAARNIRAAAKAQHAHLRSKGRCLILKTYSPFVIANYVGSVSRRHPRHSICFQKCQYQIAQEIPNFCWLPCFDICENQT
jgi:hypothetical protein